MKTGILGGTFDPIHNGHLTIAEEAMKTYQLDRILFMPAGNPYLKSEVTDYETRARMVESAIEGIPCYTLSRLEDSTENTYTFETLHALHTLYPDDTLYFIVGADSVLHMENWRCPEAIFRSCIILAARRPGYRDTGLISKIEELRKRFEADIRMLPCEAVDVSSTSIRANLREGKGIRDMVPESVARYIAEHSLYL